MNSITCFLSVVVLGCFVSGEQRRNNAPTTQAVQLAPFSDGSVDVRARALNNGSLVGEIRSYGVGVFSSGGTQTESVTVQWSLYLLKTGPVNGGNCSGAGWHSSHG